MVELILSNNPDGLAKVFQVRTGAHMSNFHDGLRSRSVINLVLLQDIGRPGIDLERAAAESGYTCLHAALVLEKWILRLARPLLAFNTLQGPNEQCDPCHHAP